MIHLWRRRKARMPYIQQLEAVECGAACLAMVLGHHGHHAPLSEVREACAVSRDGVNALAMLRAAEAYGLVARGYNVDLGRLARIPLPAILHWEFSHFVVLERLDRRGGGWIVDPAQGRLRVSRERLARAFTGAVLGFAPTPAFRSRQRRLPDLRRYRKLLGAHIDSLAQLIGFSLLLQLAGLTFPVGQRFLVDQVLARHQVSWLWSLAIALVGAALVQGALQFARGWVLAAFQNNLDLRLLTNFMRHAVGLPITFFLQRQAGDLLQRLESNGTLRAFIGSQIASSILDGLLILGYAALMLFYQWQLGLLVIDIGALRALLQLAMRGLNHQAVAAELAAQSGAGGTLLESLEALETIRAVSAESFAIRRWSDRVVRRANASLPRLQLENSAAQLTTLLGNIGVAVVSGAAGYQVITGQMSIGVFSAFLTLQGLYLTPFNALVENLEQWQYLQSYLSRLDDVLETTPEPSGGRLAENLRGQIRLDNLSFRYGPSSPWVLRRLNLRIHSGERIAIVGPSGAGKSTLAQILLGMLMPVEGVLSYDGLDIREFDLDKLRARMGAVLQQTALLNDSIAANIALNDPALTPERIRAAAELACIDEVIGALPHGYSTRLGEGGMQLSGGERQRLCLARALAHNPSVLVLDEATSALDANTEGRVHANLASLDCTRILIAHRFSTVRDADRILVIDGGQIVQEGTFATLSSQTGLFRDLLGSLAGDHD